MFPTSLFLTLPPLLIEKFRPSRKKYNVFVTKSGCYVNKATFFTRTQQLFLVIFDHFFTFFMIFDHLKKYFFCLSWQLFFPRSSHHIANVLLVEMTFAWCACTCIAWAYFNVNVLLWGNRNWKGNLRFCC